MTTRDQGRPGGNSPLPHFFFSFRRKRVGGQNDTHPCRLLLRGPDLRCPAGVPPNSPDPAGAAVRSHPHPEAGYEGPVPPRASPSGGASGRCRQAGGGRAEPPRGGEGKGGQGRPRRGAGCWRPQRARRRLAAALQSRHLLAPPRRWAPARPRGHGHGRTAAAPSPRSSAGTAFPPPQGCCARARGAPHRHPTHLRVFATAEARHCPARPRLHGTRSPASHRQPPPRGGMPLGPLAPLQGKFPFPSPRQRNPRGGAGTPAGRAQPSPPCPARRLAAPPPLPADPRHRPPPRQTVPRAAAEVNGEIPRRRQPDPRREPAAAAGTVPAARHGHAWRERGRPPRLLPTLFLLVAPLAGSGPIVRRREGDCSRARISPLCPAA